MGIFNFTKTFGVSTGTQFRPDPAGQPATITPPIGIDWMCFSHIVVDLRSRQFYTPAPTELILIVQVKPNRGTTDCPTEVDSDLGTIVPILEIPSIKWKSALPTNVVNGVPARDLVRYPPPAGCPYQPFGCAGGKLLPGQSLGIQLFGASEPARRTPAYAQIGWDITMLGTYSGPRAGELPLVFTYRPSPTRRWEFK